jgi:hypothetical protein
VTTGHIQVFSRVGLFETLVDTRRSCLLLVTLVLATTTIAWRLTKPLEKEPHPHSGPARCMRWADGPQSKERRVAADAQLDVVQKFR